MRLGKVEINYGYVVDLDNEEMVDQAKACLYQDLMNAYKYDEIDHHLVVRPDQSPLCATHQLSEGDIPSFLIEDDVERKLEN